MTIALGGGGGGSKGGEKARQTGIEPRWHPVTVCEEKGQRIPIFQAFLSARSLPSSPGDVDQTKPFVK
ncbi:hypothetical protein KOW79_011994 [Hemibagrus wyckioides]|uniref:Uncharacterized protein n=1 Tax=Hemibagrus wyckioides TaxID=337641 RepID=A0A9D3NJB9_9TELE|nr:hypothetical protein KOW79_011994 [Hemibagrus wyckioides]